VLKTLLRLALPTTLAIDLAACGEPTLGPLHVFQPILVGDTVAGRLPSGGGEIGYAFPAENDSLYAVFLQSQGGQLSLVASDTARILPLATVLVPPGLQLLDRATQPFAFGAAPVLVTVMGSTGGPFRLFVYRVRQGPEQRQVRFAVDDTVRETLETLADIDTFVVAGVAGEEVIGYLQALDSASPGVVSANLESITGTSSTVGDSDLQQETTGRIVLPGTRSYRVVVQSANDFQSGDRLYHGAYRFQLRRINRAPEGVPAVVRSGDTVSAEAIDHVGDIDEFTLVGSPGQEFNVFFQALSGSSATRLGLEAIDSGGQLLAVAQSGGGDPGLLGQATGRLQLPGGGPVRLRVFGVSNRSLADRGAYRFWVYPVNRHPEVANDTLVYLDGVTTEAIDVPGDIDEFHVTVPESTLANLVVALGGDATGGTLELSLTTDAGTPVYSVTTAGPGSAVPSGAFSLTPGNYVIRAQGYPDARSAFQGHYQANLYAHFTTAPEAVGDTIAIGDTIAAESLDPPGDVDDFTLLGHRGDHINISLQGLGTPGAGGFLSLFGGPGDQPPSVFVGSPLLADSLGAYQSNRIDLPATGWYHLRVTGGSLPPLLSEHGPYRLAVTSTGTAPEQATLVLGPGDSVTNEAIDYPGDWDEFTITGAPGQMLAILTQTLSGTGYPWLAVFDSTTGDTLATVVPQAFEKSTARFVVPPSGHLELAVFQPRGSYDFVGGYRFMVQPVNPAPESVPATYVLGDTVRGEAIFPIADLDEFTSVAPPGDTLVPWYRLTADPVSSGDLITLEVVDPTTGAVLAGAGASLIGTSPDFFSPGAFVVPAGGVYLIRIHGGGSFGDEIGTAPYEFFVRHVP
jgi:hypothetical protein